MNRISFGVSSEYVILGMAKVITDLLLSRVEENKHLYIYDKARIPDTVSDITFELEIDGDNKIVHMHIDGKGRCHFPLNDLKENTDNVRYTIRHNIIPHLIFYYMNDPFWLY